MLEMFQNDYADRIIAGNRPVDAIKGIGPKYKRELNDIGLRTTNDLVKRALRSKDRRRLFSETDLSLKDLYDWAGMASLMMVNGIGPANAEILSRAGIENLGQLANQSSVAAVRKIEQLDERQPKVVKRRPSQTTLASWIAEARILFDELELQESDTLDLTPATLRELDYRIHDILNFQNWKSFIQLGNSLRGLANLKTQELRIQQQIWRKPQGVNNPSRQFDKRRSQSKHLNISEIVKNRLTDMGESKIDIDEFVKELKQGRFDEYDSVTGLEDFDAYRHECRFLMFVGMLGAYLSILGKVNGRPRPERDFISTAMDHEIHLEEIRGLVSQEENTEVTQKDIDSIRDKVYSGLLDILQKQVDEIDRELDGILKDIYDCLVAKRLEALEKTTAVNLWLLDTQSAKLLQTVHRIWPLLYQTPNSSTAAIRLAAKLSTLLERQVLSYGTCLYFLAINYHPRLGASSVLEEEIDKARKAVFESQLPQRDFVPLPKLLEDISKFKNSVIETCGKVKLTTEWRKSDKVGFILHQDEKEIDVILKDCEYEDVLPPEGSSIVLSGELMNTQKGLMLEVEELNLKSLKKQGWLDHMTILNSDSWYTGNYVMKSDRFLRFPESARWITRMCRRLI